MVLIDWQLALLSLVFVPFMTYNSARLRLKLRSIWLHIQNALGVLTTTMQENLAGVRVVRSFSAQKYEEQKFDVTAREVLELRMDAAKSQARGRFYIFHLFGRLGGRHMVWWIESNHWRNFDRGVNPDLLLPCLNAHAGRDATPNH